MESPEFESNGFVQKFWNHMAHNQLACPESPIADGRLHRYRVSTDKRGKNGWYVLHGSDFPLGIYENWKEGKRFTWSEKSNTQLTPDDQRRRNELVSMAKKQWDEEQDRMWREAAFESNNIWKTSKKAPAEHPYLVRKKIKSHALRCHEGSLVVPVRIGADINSLQYIAPAGDKRFRRGGKIKGGYFAIGDKTKCMYLCEGYATGASIHEATDCTVIVAFSAGNLSPVANYIKAKYPDDELVICADNDIGTEGNPGISAGRKTAGELGLGLTFPELDNQRCDFNDLHISCGLEEVKRQIVENQVSSDCSSSDFVLENWPELIPFGAPDLPCLDIECLPTCAADFARDLSIATETPPELAVGMVLATCATASARRLRVVVKEGYSEPCNLWIVAALPPGNRKSAVQSEATAPLLKWERDQADIMAPEILRITSELKTLEARAKEARSKSVREKSDSKAKELAAEAAKLEVDFPEVPRPPQLWTSDATPERLGSLLAENGERLAWLSSEGGVFELLQGRYSNGIPNLDLVLKAHSGDAERVDRGSRPPVYLRNPLLTIGLSPQPEVLRGLAAKPGFRGRGLLARFLYLLPPSALGYRRLETAPMREGIRQAFCSAVHAMLEWEPSIDEQGEEQPHLLHLSKEAYAEWLEFSRAIEIQMRPQEDMENLTDWAGKAPGAAARLAGVLHGIKHAHDKPWETEITASTMNDALEIMGVVTRHSLAAMDIMGADTTVASAKRVWDWIQGRKLTSFTIREAFNALRGTFPRTRLVREALDALQERGYVIVLEPPRDRPGRPPSPTVLVRPELGESG